MSKDSDLSAHRLGAKSRVLFSTTEGRARFPDFLQQSLGDKAVIGFERYNRAIGAIVPMEAVAVLADETIDDDVRERIRRAARALLEDVRSAALRADRNYSMPSHSSPAMPALNLMRAPHRHAHDPRDDAEQESEEAAG